MKTNSISYLIWMVFRRTARAKYLPWGAFFYCLFGFSALYTGLVKNEWFFVSIGYTIGSISVGLMIVLHVLRLLSVSFDGILVWPISSQDLLKGVNRVAQMITIGLYTPAMLLVIYYNASILPHFLAAMLFSLFVVQPVYIRLMLFETNRYDVTKGMFATGDAMVSRPFLNNLATIGFAGLCIGLSWLASQADLLNVLWLFFAIFGGIGLLLSSSIHRNEVTTFQTNRYVIANGFRKK